ncbi:MAG: hypothetical protein AB7N24_21385 [Dehalococcoidia bacterium]
MGISTLLYKLASPYDAYVSHVSGLNGAIGRIRYMSTRALGYEAGLQSSMRIVPGGLPADERVQMFRQKLGAAAQSMTDEQFEDFLSHLGGGEAANVEADRARTVARMSHTTRGIAEYFEIAAKELATLESRGYNPNRPDVARQLRENKLPAHTTAEYRKILHDLGKSVGVHTE